MNEERKPNIENMLPFWSRDMRSIAVYDQRRSFSFRQSDRGALVWFSCRDPAYLLFAFIFLVGNECLFISPREKVQTILQKCLGIKWMWHILDFFYHYKYDFIYSFYPFFSPVVEWPLTNICCNSETCLPTNKWLTEWSRGLLAVCFFCNTTNIVN